jgi:hypothetical protein
MALTLTLLDSDASLGVQDRGGISFHDSSDLFLVLSATNELVSFSWDGASLGAAAAVNGTPGDNGGVVSPNGLFIAVMNTVAKTLKVFNLTGNTWGSLVATSSAYTGDAGYRGIAWSPDGDFIAVAHSGGAFLFTCTFNGSSLGSPVIPSSPPSFGAHSNSKQCISWSPDGNSLATTQDITSSGAELIVYPMTGGAFGTPVTPSPINANSALGGMGTAWSSDSAFVAVGFDKTPYCAVYPWSGSALGTIITPTGTDGTGYASCVVFSKTDNALFVGGKNMNVGGTVQLRSYEFNGTTLASPVEADTHPGNDVRGLALSADNTSLATFDIDEDVDVYATGLSLTPAFVITSTIVASANEDQVAEGSLEIIATITNQTWDTDLGSDDPATEDFLAAFVSAQNEALGWNAIVVGNNYRKKVLDDSPIMYIRGNAVTDLGSLGVSAAATSLGTGNALLLSSAQKSYRYNLAAAKLQVTDEAGLLNLFAGGGTYEAVFTPWASGFSVDTGTLLFKENGYNVSTGNQQNGFVDIFLRREFSTAGGVWVLRGKVPIGLQTHLVIAYDDTATTNDPTFYVNGVAYTVDGVNLEETQTPQGSATSDTTKDIFIGSNSSLALTFNGDMQEVALYTSVLSQARVTVHINAASYQYGLDFNDVTRTSSTVITVNMREFPLYDIVAQETITATFPDTTHSGSAGDVVATPTFTIDPSSRVIGFTPKPGEIGFVFGNVNGGLGPAAGDAFRVLGAGDEWVFGMPQMSVGLAGTDLPRILLVRVTEISEDES